LEFASRSDPVDSTLRHLNLALIKILTRRIEKPLKSFSIDLKTLRNGQRHGKAGIRHFKSKSSGARNASDDKTDTASKWKAVASFGDGIVAASFRIGETMTFALQ
jgi:hypothetical protein